MRLAVLQLVLRLDAKREDAASAGIRVFNKPLTLFHGGLRNEPRTHNLRLRVGVPEDNPDSVNRLRHIFGGEWPVPADASSHGVWSVGQFILMVLDAVRHRPLGRQGFHIDLRGKADADKRYGDGVDCGGVHGCSAVVVPAKVIPAISAGLIPLDLDLRAIGTAAGRRGLDFSDPRPAFVDTDVQMPCGHLRGVGVPGKENHEQKYVLHGSTVCCSLLEKIGQTDGR